MEENFVKLGIVMELLVKFVKNVIQIEKTNKNNKANTKYENLGIGNAIVDVICKVNENF